MNGTPMTYEQSLLELTRVNPGMMVLTAENRAAIRNLPDRLGDRFIDFGICEQTMVGAAAGLALRGRLPVVHALAAFLTMRAFEFIRTDVGIAHLPVKLVGGVPGFLSEANGPTHQAIEDIALMRGIPGMQVFCPADIEDLLLGMPEVLTNTAPAYIRFAALPAVVHHTPFLLGKAEELSEGDDVGIVTYGFLVREAMAAAHILVERGRTVRVVNLRTLSPVDEDMILHVAQETSLLITLEDHLLTGGLFSIVSELVTRYHVSGLNVLPLALGHRWFRPGLLHDVLVTEGFTGQLIADRILDELQ